jgi:hypothetical protein
MAEILKIAMLTAESLGAAKTSDCGVNQRGAGAPKSEQMGRLL